MEKPNHKPKKVICPRCKGNGYIKIPHESVEKLNKLKILCSQYQSLLLMNFYKNLELLWDLNCL